MICTVVVARNFTHPMDVVIDEKDVILTHSLFCCVFKIMLNLSKTYVCETVKIYIIYSYENAFDILLNKSNQKLLKQ